MPVPGKTEGPVSRNANDLRLRKHRRANYWGIMRCLCPKRPKGRFAGAQMTLVSANTAGPVVGKSMRCPFPKSPKGLSAGTQTTCVHANAAGPAVGEACDARARKDRRASLQGRKRLACRKHRMACCRGSMRCLCPKSTKGLFAGTQSTCVHANTAGRSVREACDAHAPKDRRAC